MSIYAAPLICFKCFNFLFTLIVVIVFDFMLIQILQSVILVAGTASFKFLISSLLHVADDVSRSRCNLSVYHRITNPQRIRVVGFSIYDDIILE